VVLRVNNVEQVTIGLFQTQTGAMRLANFIENGFQ